MKKASKQTVSKKTWNQIIGLYPYLVQFTETNSPQIGKAVKDALLEYHDLLQPLLCPWFMNKFLLEYITIEANQKLAFFGFKIDLFWFETNPGIDRGRASQFWFYRVYSISFSDLKVEARIWCIKKVNSIALSFYKSQNVLCWSKCFGREQ